MQRISKTFLAGRRAVPALCSVPQSTRKTEGGAHKKGRLRCHKQPKSREETPKEGSDSGATAYPYLRRSRSAAQLNGGEGRASKGVTERYEGLWRSPLKPTTSARGQNRKSSMRANVFRCSPNNGHCQDTSVCPLRARTGPSVPAFSRSQATLGTPNAPTTAVLSCPTGPGLLARRLPRGIADMIVGPPWHNLRSSSVAFRPIAFFERTPTSWCGQSSTGRRCGVVG
jgi:hypothetical protein